MDTDFLIELWEVVRPYINAKDRLHIADELVSLYDAHGHHDLEASMEYLPAELRAAAITLYDLDDEDDEDEQW